MTNLSTLYAQKIAAGDLRPDPAQEAVLPQFDRISDGLMAEPVKRGLFRRASPPPAPKGLYLWGGVGRGKSMLMDLFVDSLGDIPARRVHFHAFMQEIHAKMHEARKNGVQDALAPVAQDVVDSVRVLAFDEMQISDITDAMIVGRLFEALFAADVCVVTTSNRLPDELYKNGLNRQLFLPFIGLIKEKMEVWEMVSPVDYRQDRLKGSEVYFAPADATARASLQSI
jgi:cell division protein ZapE